MVETKLRLYGLAELAQAVGVSSPVLAQWRSRNRHDVPEPAAELACGPVWTQAVEDWIDTMREGAATKRGKVNGACPNCGGTKFNAVVRGKVRYLNCTRCDFSTWEPTEVSA